MTANADIEGALAPSPTTSDPCVEQAQPLSPMERVRVEIRGKLVSGKMEYEIFRTVPPSTGGKDKIDCKKDKNWLMVFEYTNIGAANVRIDASKPFFVSEDCVQCPHDFDSKDFMVDSCNASRLEVINWNTVCKDYRFQINFVEMNGDPAPPFDPIIKNDGGGIRPLI